MSQIVGTDGGSIPCRPAPHAAVSVVGQESEYFTSFLSTPQNYGDVQRLSRSKPMEETSCRRKTITTDASLTAGGGGPSRMSSLWSLDRGASWLAHKSFENAGSLPGSQTVLTSIEGLSRPSQDGQHDGCFVPESLARRVLLWAQTKFLSVRAVHVPGHLNSGADLLSRLAHPQLVNLIWQRFRSSGSVLVCFEHDYALPALVFPVSPITSRSGCSGPQMAQDRPSLGGSSQTRSVDLLTQHDLASSTGIMEVVGVAPERSALMCSGLSAESMTLLLILGLPPRDDCMPSSGDFSPLGVDGAIWIQFTAL
ncbi:cAMP-dependent protein kinase catalytic subunit [Labeo rohita]|uniref:cAMP-dependent protein kinase catalytic subunit n=1 Tax=Labeo rohita TaxID=84645 RepID=A0ABQ8MWB5_LABRO|nr:cAMP-dependent protein kinase catalytic subunit [Labeo rohita]